MEVTAGFEPAAVQFCKLSLSSKCSTMAKNGRWYSTRCQKTYRYLCKTIDSNNFMITESSGKFSQGQRFCEDEFKNSIFSSPRDGHQNKNVRGLIKNNLWIKYH